MAYRKSVVGEHNQANETASHNSIQIETGNSLTIFAVYLIALVTGSIIFIAIAYGQYLKYAIVATFAGIVITGWIYLINWTRRNIEKTKTVIAIETYARSRAALEANIAVAMENYAIFKDENGRIRFEGSTQITENRHFPAQIEAPKEVTDDKTVLELWDKGLSARAIEKAFDKKVPYRKITDILTTYRPDWNRKGKGMIIDEYADSDE